MNITIPSPAHLNCLVMALEQRLEQLDEDLRSTPFPRKQEVECDIDRVREMLRQLDPRPLTDPART